MNIESPVFWQGAAFGAIALASVLLLSEGICYVAAKGDELGEKAFTEEKVRLSKIELSDREKV